MIKRSIKLEVICNDEKDNKERLNIFNGEYFKTLIANRVHMSNEGELAFYDRTSVDLLKQSIDFDSTLPSNTIDYTLCINSYNEYISDYTSVIERVSSEPVMTIGKNIYSNESCENIIINEECNNDYMLKLISKYIKALSKYRKLNNCDDLTEEEKNDMINKIKELCDEVNIRTSKKNNNNKKLILK